MKSVRLSFILKRLYISSRKKVKKKKEYQLILTMILEVVQLVPCPPQEYFQFN